MAKVTSKDRRYVGLRKSGVDHIKAWRETYRTTPPEADDVPEHLLSLIGASSSDEFSDLHKVASTAELKEFWTMVVRDKEAALGLRISAASELAKAKGVFAAASKKTPPEPKQLTDQQIKDRIEKLQRERELESDE